MTPGAAEHAAGVWEKAIASFLRNRSSVVPELEPWFACAQGLGAGNASPQYLPEPYIGRLDETSRAALLALGPGERAKGFQEPDGVFADEIRELGSYAAWAATSPFLREPWLSGPGPNLHFRSRLRFVRNWFEDPAIRPDEVLHMELFPWHSKIVTAPMVVPTDIVDEFVFVPLAALRTPIVFAFGAPWFHIAAQCGFRKVKTLGEHAPAHDGAPANRRILVARRDNLTLVLEKRSGTPGPPRAASVPAMRAAIEPYLL